MQQSIQCLDILTHIAQKYNVDISTQTVALHDVQTYSVTLPIVGAFNTGKSSAVNALFGRPLLPTGIVPEVCPPVEIRYGDNELAVYRDEIMQRTDLCALRDRSVELAGVTRIVLKTDSEQLRVIENITLVDLPGYDSGTEQHERWVRDHLLNCYAYLLVIAADEPVVKHSLVQLLSTYATTQKPVFVMLTKCDKLPQKDISRNIEFVRETIRTFLPSKTVHIAKVSSGRDAYLDELHQLLTQINGYLVGEKEQQVKRQLLFMCNCIKTVLANEMLYYQLPVSERHRLVQKHQSQFGDFLESHNKKTRDLAGQVVGAVDRAARDLSTLTQELCEPLLNVTSSGQDVNTFLSGIIPAFINKLSYAQFYPIFFAHQRELNSRFELYGLLECSNEIKESDVTAPILEVSLQKEEDFKQGIAAIVNRLGRRVKKQDGDVIVRELLLPELQQHILECIRTGVQHFLREYKVSGANQISMAQDIKDRVGAGLCKTQDDDDDKDLTSLKADIETIEHLTEQLSN